MNEENLSPVLSGDKDHSKYGCSTHPSLAICPGYESSGGTNPAAEKGNDLHDLGAEALEACLDGLPFELMIEVGDELPCGQIFEAADEQKVEAYVSHCMSLVKDYPQCTIRKVEVPQPMASLGLPNDITTPDFIMIEPFGLVIIMDLKTGKGIVKPTSEQLRSYGLEAYEDYGCTEMLCCVSQDCIMLTKHYVDVEISFYKEHMSRMIEMAQWENPPLVPGKACTYCGRDCSVRNGAVTTGAAAMMSVNPEELSPDQVAHFLEFTEIFDAAVVQLGRIKARGHALEESGVPIRGWHLESGNATNVWRNEAAAKETILKLFANHKKRVKLDPVPAKGAKTELVDAPIDAKEVSIVTVKTRSLNQVHELVGRSKAVVEALAPHVMKIPSTKNHLRRDKKQLTAEGK